MSNLHDITREDLETIEKYLDGTLSPEASEAFEKRLEENEKLRNTVSEFKQIFRDLEGAVLKDKMQDFHKSMLLRKEGTPPEKEFLRKVETADKNELLRNVIEPKTIPKSTNRLHFLKYAAAASVVLLVAIAGIWYMNQPSEHERLYAIYFTPDPGLITPMSSQTDYVFYDAMVDYKREEYARAIAKWEGLVPEKPNNDTLNYFIGVSHLANGNAQNAIAYLKTATTFPQSVFKEDAHFYLGMAYLKLEDIPQAKQALSNSTHEKSKEVLNKLE